MDIQLFHFGTKGSVPWTIDQVGFEAGILIDADDGTIFRLRHPPIPCRYVESFNLDEDGEGELDLTVIYRTKHGCQDEPSVFSIGKVPLHLRDEVYDFVRSLEEAFGYKIEI